MEGQHWLCNPRSVTVKERFCGLNVELPPVWNASICLAEGICYSCGCLKPVLHQLMQKSSKRQWLWIINESQPLNGHTAERVV